MMIDIICVKVSLEFQNYLNIRIYMSYLKAQISHQVHNQEPDRTNPKTNGLVWAGSNLGLVWFASVSNITKPTYLVLV